jgi:hypothetical protein
MFRSFSTLKRFQTVHAFLRAASDRWNLMNGTVQVSTEEELQKTAITYSCLRVDIGVPSTAVTFSFLRGVDIGIQRIFY